MEIFGYFVPGVFIGILIAFVISIVSDRASIGEQEANERFPTPSWHQVAWHILHSRQDLRLANLMLVAILLTLWIKL